MDAHGLPVRVLVTSGTTADCTVADELIEGFEAQYLLADKGYDTDAIVKQAHRQGMTPVIPVFIVGVKVFRRQHGRGGFKAFCLGMLAGIFTNFFCIFVLSIPRSIHEKASKAESSIGVSDLLSAIPLFYLFLTVLPVWLCFHYQKPLAPQDAKEKEVQQTETEKAPPEQAP